MDLLNPGQSRNFPFKKKLIERGIVRASLVYILTSLILWKVVAVSSDLLDLDEQYNSDSSP